MDEEITLRIKAINAARQGLESLRNATERTAKSIRTIWESANTRIGGAFKVMVSVVRTSFVQLQRFARRSARGIVSIFRGVARAVRAMFSLPGLIAGAAVGGLLGRGFGESFRAQRTEAQLQVFARTQEQQTRVRAFGRARGGGLFRGQDVTEAAVTGRRFGLNNPQAFALADQLRDVVSASEEISTLSEGVRRVSRAALFKETEGVEALGLNLTEKAIEASEAFKTLTAETGKTIGKLTQAELVAVTFQAAIEQASRFQGIENKLLDQTAGKWQVIKNTVSDFLLLIGNRLGPLLDDILTRLQGVLGFLFDLFTRNEGLMANLTVIFGRMKTVVVAVFQDLGNIISDAIAGGVARGINAVIPGVQKLVNVLPAGLFGEGGRPQLQALNVPSFRGFPQAGAAAADVLSGFGEASFVVQGGPAPPPAFGAEAFPLPSARRGAGGVSDAFIRRGRGIVARNRLFRSIGGAFGRAGTAAFGAQMRSAFDFSGFGQFLGAAPPDRDAGPINQPFLRFAERRLNLPAGVPFVRDFSRQSAEESAEQFQRLQDLQRRHTQQIVGQWASMFESMALQMARGSDHILVAFGRLITNISQQIDNPFARIGGGIVGTGLQLLGIHLGGGDSPRDTAPGRPSLRVEN